MLRFFITYFLWLWERSVERLSQSYHYHTVPSILLSHSPHSWPTALWGLRGTNIIIFYQAWSPPPQLHHSFITSHRPTGPRLQPPTGCRKQLRRTLSEMKRRFSWHCSSRGRYANLLRAIPRCIQTYPRSTLFLGQSNQERFQNASVDRNEASLLNVHVFR